MKKLAIVLKGYPRLSETFIAQELLELQKRGLEYDIWSLRFPTDKKRHPINEKITANLRYLPEYLYQEPFRVLKAMIWANFRIGYWKAVKIWLKDLARDTSSNRVRRFGQACVMSRELGPETHFTYAHFLHTPSSVARYAAIIRGEEWGFSAHAKDIWTSPDWEISEKLTDSNFGVTCTGVGAAHLRGLSSHPEDMDLAYHGLDLSRFPDPIERDKDKTEISILSVGRLVTKKGYDILLKALAKMPANINWHFTHIGGGGLSDALEAQAETLGISDKITWMGAQAQTEVIAAMQSADIFVLPSRIADDGDRDGLPNVLMEAASQKLALVSTSVSSIPEFIDTGTHGLLVEQNDDHGLMEALATLADDADMRAKFSNAAYDRLVAEFGITRGIDMLMDRLNQALK